MMSQFSEMMSLSSFYWRCCVSLVIFRYWSKFHVNIITGSGDTTIPFYKGLARNPEIRNTTIGVLPNIWRLGQVRNTKFGTNVSNKMLLNAAKYRVTAFIISELLKGKPTRGRVKSPPTQISVEQVKAN